VLPGLIFNLKKKVGVAVAVTAAQCGVLFSHLCTPVGGFLGYCLVRGSVMDGSVIVGIFWPAGGLNVHVLQVKFYDPLLQEEREVRAGRMSAPCRTWQTP